MRVFVTGASGFIGSAIVQELLRAGHQVLGLARSDASARAVANAGAEVHRGSLEDLDSLKRGASESDGVIHTAFSHDFINDFSRFQASNEMDRRAIETICSTLAGSGRPFVNSSGIGLLRPDRLATEEDAPDPHSFAALRVPSEEATMAAASQGVRASAVRLPPTVHGEGEKGFIPMLIAIAREKGVSAYIGAGQNRWPAVHRFDAAHLYRLALEKGEAGKRYHAIGDEGVPFREISEAIGRGLNVPVVSKSLEEAPVHFGWIGAIASGNLPASSALTQEWLGWHPTYPGLIADIDQGHYFTE